MKAVILAGGLGTPVRRDVAAAEADGRDRGAVDPVAHHADVSAYGVTDFVICRRLSTGVLLHDAAAHQATSPVERVLAAERAGGLSELAGYTRFAEEVVAVKCATLKVFIALREEGKVVVAYGAAAKGNIFLNYCCIGPDLVRAVADRSPHKQGTLLPGVRIPVVSLKALLAMKRDYLLILPWNLKDEVAGQMAEIRA